MDTQFVIALVLALPATLLVFALGRETWRMIVLNEEPEAGGSYGRQ